MNQEQNLWKAVRMQRGVVGTIKKPKPAPGDYFKDFPVRKDTVSTSQRRNKRNTRAWIENWDSTCSTEQHLSGNFPITENYFPKVRANY